MTIWPFLCGTSLLWEKICKYKNVLGNVHPAFPLWH
jgi:hypothetical protein